MAMLNKLRLRLRALFLKSRMEDELQAELQFHLEREIEENIIRGMTPEEARSAAIRSFGGVERVKEESREARGVRLLEEVWQDLRYGARMLLKQAGWSSSGERRLTPIRTAPGATLSKSGASRRRVSSRSKRARVFLTI